MWRLVHQWSFLLFDCLLTVFGTLLVHDWYSLGRHVTIGTPMIIFAVLTVFWQFLTIGTLLLHCWYKLGRHVNDWYTNAIFADFTVFWLFLTIRTLLVQSWYTCDDWYTNGHKQSKTVKRQSKQHKWPLVYQSSHVYQDCTTVYQQCTNHQQELSYCQQIARQLRIQYAEGIYMHKYFTVTLKSRLSVTQGHWKQNHWIDHKRLSSSRVIWRWILLWPWNVG